jgi:hypothetical protein
VLKISLLATALFVLAACLPLQPVCEDTGPDGLCQPQRVLANYESDGFELNLTHSRYQWAANLDRMMAACRESIHQYAERLAAAKGHGIQAIDNDKIAVSIDRDHVWGVSTCKATYDVAYKD